ncbi:MAG: hypothetical protein PWP28_1661 [Oceanotoga sp.]|uniref:2-hydroxyacid dehydrogenase n=1 Tax=Oceanotoga sp. TaxID=2108366 RepID=UPI00264AF4A6|nr:2-hydroxyacid dehydrogenase [Oceanotoga sp.]MDN5342786.1 hypothetical protein [Oceanotoga sp.]
MKFLFDHILTDYWKVKIEEISNEFKNFNVIKKDPNIPLKEQLEDIDCLIGGSIKKEDLTKAKNLKAIFVPFSGVNTLPLKDLKKSNIIVSNSKGNGKVVAERAVSLLMSLTGKIIEYDEDLRKNIWHGFAAGENPESSWESIIEKKVGILGVGSIGKNIAKYLKPYDCKIIGYKKNIVGQSKDYDEYFDIITNNFDYTIKNSDIIFISLPLTDSTRDLINKDNIIKFKNKIIINVGRGPIISQEALYIGLKENILKGACIDVWYNYPEKNSNQCMPLDYPINEFKNIILSPHVGGFNEKALKLSIDWCVENIKAYLNTGKPKNIVKI